MPPSRRAIRAPHQLLDVRHVQRLGVGGLGPRRARLHQREAALGAEPRGVTTFGRRGAQRGQALARAGVERGRALVAQVGEQALAERRRARPRRGITRERAAGELGELGGQRFGVSRWRRGARGGEHLAEIRALVWRLAGQDLVEHAAQEVHVGGRAERARGLVDHLGREVRRRADELLAIERGELVGVHREAPVDEVDLAVAAEHDVGRLEVAVQDAAAVRERDGAGHLRQHEDRATEEVVADADRGPRGVPRLGEELGEAHAGDALHHHERRAGAVDDQAVHRHHRGVLERAGDAGLAHQDAARRVAEVGARDLHRHVARHRALARRDHAPGAALAEDRAELEVRHGAAVLGDRRAAGHGGAGDRERGRERHRRGQGRAGIVAGAGLGERGQAAVDGVVGHGGAAR